VLNENLSQSTIVNDFYQATLNSYQSGEVSYEIKDLPAGNPAYLRLEKSFQKNLKTLEANMVITTLIPQFSKSCTGGTATDQEKAWVDIITHLQKAAIHNEIYNIIADNPENDLTPIRLLDKYLKNKKVFDCAPPSED
jgi:hypothetical protein